MGNQQGGPCCGTNKELEANSTAPCIIVVKIKIIIEKKTNKKTSNAALTPDRKCSQFMNLSQYDTSFNDADMQLENSELERAENFFNSSGKISKEDFDIIKVIGRGGFGKVYMVKKRTNKKVFAMKVLSKD